MGWAGSCGRQGVAGTAMLTPIMARAPIIVWQKMAGVVPQVVRRWSVAGVAAASARAHAGKRMNVQRRRGWECARQMRAAVRVQAAVIPCCQGSFAGRMLWQGNNGGQQN